MGFKDAFLNVVSLGAHGRIQNAVDGYEDILEELNNLHKEYEAKREEVNKVIEDVIEVKRKAITAVKKTQLILNNLSIKQRDLANQHIGNKGFSLEKINESIAIADGLVSETLGGGTIIAGGRGIAVGAAVLGGLVPVIAVTGLLQHLAANKKIAELKKEEIKIVKLMEEIKKNLVQLDAIKMRSNELIESINKSLEAYEYEYKKAMSKIYPHGAFSRLLKRIRKNVFKMDYFSKNDYIHIQDLGLTIGFILKMVDSPVS